MPGNSTDLDLAGALRVGQLPGHRLPERPLPRRAHRRLPALRDTAPRPQERRQPVGRAHRLAPAARATSRPGGPDSTACHAAAGGTPGGHEPRGLPASGRRGRHAQVRVTPTLRRLGRAGARALRGDAPQLLRESPDRSPEGPLRHGAGPGSGPTRVPPGAERVVVKTVTVRDPACGRPPEPDLYRVSVSGTASGDRMRGLRAAQRDPQDRGDPRRAPGAQRQARQRARLRHARGQHPHRHRGAATRSATSTSAWTKDLGATILRSHTPWSPYLAGAGRPAGGS